MPLQLSFVILHTNAFAVEALPCKTLIIHAISVVEVRAYTVLNWEEFILGAPLPKCVQNTVLSQSFRVWVRRLNCVILQFLLKPNLIS